MRLIIEDGRFDFNNPFSLEYYPLHVAVSYGTVETVKMILSVLPDEVDYMIDVLTTAVTEEKYDVVEILRNRKEISSVKNLLENISYPKFKE